MRTTRFDFILKLFLPVGILAVVSGWLIRSKLLFLHPLNSAWLTHYLSEWFGYGRYAGSMVDAPMVSFFYGPLTTLVYLPTLLFKTPTGMLVAAGAINIVLSLLPPAYLWIKMRKHGSDPLFLIYALLLFYLVAQNTLPFFIIHPDLFATTLIVFACLILCFDSKPHHKRSYLAAALFSVMAVWSKQIAFPITLCIPFYVLMRDGKNRFIEYIQYLFAIGVIVSAPIVLYFGVDKIALNMFTLPLVREFEGPFGHGVHDSFEKFKIYLSGFHMLMIHISPYALLTMLLTGARIRTALRRGESLRIFLRGNHSALLTLTALCMAPTAVLAFAIMGGAAGNFVYVTYPLLMALTIELIHYTKEATSQNTFSRILIKDFVFSLVVIFTVINLSGLRATKEISQLYQSNQHQEAYEIAKQYPHQIYIPWHPLSSALAERKIYHTDDGVHERETANLPLSQKEYMEYLPSELKYIALYDAQLPTNIYCPKWQWWLLTKIFPHNHHKFKNLYAYSTVNIGKIYSERGQELLDQERVFPEGIDKPGWKFYKIKRTG